jgi:ketosteroid isomerase-like protein
LHGASASFIDTRSRAIYEGVFSQSAGNRSSTPTAGVAPSTHSRIDANIGARLAGAGILHQGMPMTESSAAIEPVQVPITGDEDFGDLSRPIQALAQFYRGFNARDLDLIDANFSATDDVVIDNPIGGIRRGRHQPRLMYEKIFASAADVRVEFWDYTIILAADVFVAVGRERGSYFARGRRHELSIRTTRIFRRTEGKWRQVHHHGSIDDARMLASFQEAV